ncbi:MAG: methyltransferase domain-containing protein, partial [Chlamydiota bacterium]|nr:methyltransferase domain-containing protein [Chlamydiota bacterium]
VKIHTIDARSTMHDAAPLLGIPRFPGAHLPQDLIYVHGVYRDGVLHITMTEAMWEKISKGERGAFSVKRLGDERRGGEQPSSAQSAIRYPLLSEFIDHEQFETVDAPAIRIAANLKHRRAAQRARYFASKNTLSPFHDFFFRQVNAMDITERLRYLRQLYNEKREFGEQSELRNYEILFRKKIIENMMVSFDEFGFFKNTFEMYAYRDAIERLDLVAGQRYLHVGAAHHKVVPILSLMGVQCTFMDIDPGQIDKTRDLMHQLPSALLAEAEPVHWVAANIADIPETPGLVMPEFDVISLFHVLYDFKGDRAKAMQNVIKLVKDQGAIWFTPRTQAQKSDQVEAGRSGEALFDMEAEFQLQSAMVDENIRLERDEHKMSIRDLKWPDFSDNYAYRVSKSNVQDDQEPLDERRPLQDEVATAGDLKDLPVEAQIQNAVQDYMTSHPFDAFDNPDHLSATIEQLAEHLIRMGFSETLLGQERILNLIGRAMGRQLSLRRTASTRVGNNILGQKERADISNKTANILGVRVRRVAQLLERLLADDVSPQIWLEHDSTGTAVVRRNNLFGRILEKLLELSGSGIRLEEKTPSYLYQQYAKQLILTALDDNSRRDIKTLLERETSFAQAFRDQYGTLDAEVILVKFSGYMVAGEGKDLFEIESVDGFSIADKLGEMGVMGRIEFPSIAIEDTWKEALAKSSELIRASNIARIKDFSQETPVQETLDWLVQALFSLSPELRGRSPATQADKILKDLLIEYRTLIVSGIDGAQVEAYEPVADILKIMLRKSDQDGLPMTLYKLLGAEEGANSADPLRKLDTLAAQVHYEDDMQNATQAGLQLRRGLIQGSSPVLRSWDTLISSDVIEKESDAEDKHIYIIDINTLVEKFELHPDKMKLLGVGAGFDQILEKLFDVKPGVRVMLMRGDYQIDQVREILRSLGVSEERIGTGKGKLEIVDDWGQNGRFEEIIRGALGVDRLDADQRLEARKGIVTILSESTRKKLQDLESFKNEMKIVVGKIGIGPNANYLSDVVGLALLLGSVDEAYDEKRQLLPEVNAKLRAFLTEIASDLLDDVKTEDKDRLISQMIKEVKEDGFFKLPRITDNLNQMLRDVIITKNYIDIAA